MELACDIMDIGTLDICPKETYSGIGHVIYVAYPEDLVEKPFYENGEAAFSLSSFVFKPGRGAYRIYIKKKSGRIQSVGYDRDKGYKVNLMFTIERALEKSSRLLRILKNREDAIFFVVRFDGGYYVVYDPVFGTKVSNSYDSGKAPDSDRGYSVTVTCDPSKYPLTKWDGTLTILKRSLSFLSTEDGRPIFTERNEYILSNKIKL